MTLRENTGQSETVAAGANILVGTDSRMVVESERTMMERGDALSRTPIVAARWERRLWRLSGDQTGDCTIHTRWVIERVLRSLSRYESSIEQSLSEDQYRVPLERELDNESIISERP